MSKHAVIYLRLRAVIGEFTFNDVIQWTGSWALNTIPSASITVAIGRNVETNELATIHRAAKSLTTQLKAEVFLTTKVEDVDDAVPGVPGDAEFKVFDGYVAGTGWQRTETGGHFVIHLTHWLSSLNEASAMSASLNPGSPGDMAYPAVFPAIGLMDSMPDTSSIPAWVPNISKSLVNEAGFSDIWGNILHKWLTSLAQADPYDLALGNSKATGDPKIMEAVKRCGVNTDGVPLNVDLKGSSAAMFVDSMSGALINEVGSNWVNTTLWGKIIGEWAPAYWFSVVPRITDALIVPFTGGLQGKPWAVISDDDYIVADINGQLPQSLRAVGIIHPLMTSTSYDLNVNIPLVSRGGTLGMYQPEGVTSGMILYKDAPKWLADPSVAFQLSVSAEGIPGSPIGNVMDEVGTGEGIDGNRDFDADISSLKRMASAYAHQWFVIESLKGRTGELVGKLRFDISPGSNVLVKAGGASNVPDADNITEDLYATVMQVTYMINAESQRAATGFSLSHIRTEKENTLPATSVDKPPLYQKAWFGAKLVPDVPAPGQG